MMRALILLMLLAFAGPAFGETHTFSRADVGTLKIALRDVGPIYARFEMHVSVLCKDERRVKNLILPAWEDVIPKENVCFFGEPKFDEATGEVTIAFGTSKFRPGQARCDEGWTQKFNLRELCGEWRN